MVGLLPHWEMEPVGEDPGQKDSEERTLGTQQGLYVYYVGILGGKSKDIYNIIYIIHIDYIYNIPYILIN